MTSRSENPGKLENQERGPILALDAGGHACSAAVWQSGEIRAHEAQFISHGQAAALMPMVERVMQRAAIAYQNLARIAVAVGPGGFTGLRVAIATARGLGLAASIPVVGISSFQAAASNRIAEGQRRRIFVLIDSRREEPYLAELNADLAMIGKPRMLSMAEAVALISVASPALVLGDRAAALDGAVIGDIRVCPTRVDAAAVVALAADPSGRFDLLPLPIYLRPPDVTQPKPVS